MNPLIRSFGLRTAALLPAAILMAALPVSDELHERKEVAGLAVVFGAEPEPALSDEMQFLRWRASDLGTEQPYADFQDARVVVSHAGSEYGPFAVRPVRREPGTYQTQHVFTVPGEYTSVLSFQKGEDATVHQVDFDFNIGDRASLELPPRKIGNR